MRLVPGSNLVFVHITKTGGMSVTSYLGLEHSPKDHFIRKDEEPLLGEDYVRFCVVRDPFARFVSAYKYTCHMALHGEGADKEVRNLVMSENLHGDINRFVRTCRERGFPLEDDLHFRPQIWWLKRARPQFLLRLEHIHSDIRIIDRLLGRPAGRFPHVNEKKEVEGADVTLDSNSMAFCRALYKSDFQALGYSTTG